MCILKWMCISRKMCFTINSCKVRRIRLWGADFPNPELQECFLKE